MQLQESLRAQFWVLSYLLFLIYVDDVINGPFSPGTRIILYSDDILLYRTISSSSDYSYQSCNQITGLSKLQPRFSTLSNASLHWSLANWTGKTTCLLVYNNQWPNAGNCLYIQISRLVSHIWLVLVKTYRRSMHQEKILGLLYRRFYHNADVKLFTNYTFPLYNPTESMQLFYSSS